MCGRKHARHPCGSAAHAFPVPAPGLRRPVAGLPSRQGAARASCFGAQRRLRVPSSVCWRGKCGASPGVPVSDSKASPAMGQAKSRRRKACGHPPGSPPPQAPMDLDLLPHELLVLILSWVPGRILVTRCRLVCRKWRELIDSPVLWKLRWERDPSQHEALRATLEAARHCPRMEWGRVGVLQPFGRNLIKNPRGEAQFQHWEVGHGDSICMGGSTCWISQLIDLVKEGLSEDLLDTFQPDIFISDWWGTHEKCGCRYNMYVLLLAADKRSAIARFVTEPDPAEEWNVPFQQASHIFRKYGPGVRYLRFQHLGNQSWAEHTEPHITNSTVRVTLTM